MDDISRLTAIEEIRNLKARYFRFVDYKQWDELRSVFTDDAIAEFPSAGSITGGSAAIVEALTSFLDGVLTVHHGYLPEIQVLDSTSATGIWAMDDMLIWPRRGSTEPTGEGLATWPTSVRGYGHYFERYELVGDRWQISRPRLTRLHYESVSHGATEAGMPPSPAV
jgi:hypothetical protein